MARHFVSGYNHPSMIKIWEDPHNIRTLVNRPALGVYPGVDWPSMLKDILLSVAPKGLDQVSENIAKILNLFYHSFMCSLVALLSGIYVFCYSNKM